MTGGQPSVRTAAGLSVQVDGRFGQKGLCCDCVVMSVKSRPDWLAAQELAPGVQ